MKLGIAVSPLVESTLVPSEDMWFIDGGKAATDPGIATISPQLRAWTFPSNRKPEKRQIMSFWAYPRSHFIKAGRRMMIVEAGASFSTHEADDDEAYLRQ